MAAENFSASSSRQARRWLNGSVSLLGMDAQRSIGVADGLGSDVPLTHSNGTPAAERRTPVKVPLPMLLDQRLPNLSAGDVRTVSDEKALHAIASAQALVLSSLAGILRMVRGDKACGLRGLRVGQVAGGGQLSARSHRSHASASATALPSARSFGGVLFQDSTMPGFILDPVTSKSLLWGCGEGGDAAVARSAALSSSVLMLCDGATVPLSAPPANADAAARTVMRLMNTTRARDSAVGLSPTALRQVLVRVLLLLCQGPMVMEPLSRTLAAVHERWMPPPSQRHSAKVLRQLPFAIGHRMHVLASRLEAGGDTSAARAACACLQITSMLIACDSSASVQGSVFKACIEPVERIAEAISGNTSPPQHWNKAYLALMSQMVDTLSRMMRSPLLPDVVGQRIISLFSIRRCVLETAMQYTRAVLFDSIPEVSQLQVLDLWSSYTQLVSRQPECSAEVDVSTHAVSVVNATTGRSDMHQATLSTVNDIGSPLAPPVERVGHDSGAADVISEWTPAPEGGLGSTEGLMPLESLRIDESLIGGHHESRHITRAGALQVCYIVYSQFSYIIWKLVLHDCACIMIYQCLRDVVDKDSSLHGDPMWVLQVLQPLVDLPLGVLMRLLHTPALPAEVQLGALATLRNVYASRGCPFVASEDLADRYIQIHYVMFLKLYLLPQQPSTDGPDPPLSAHSMSSSVRSASSTVDNGSSRRARCLAHLHVLIALAGHKHKHVQLLFQRHKVLQFLAAELSLEFHAKRHGSLGCLRAHTAPSRTDHSRPSWVGAHDANADVHRGGSSIVSQPSTSASRPTGAASYSRSCAARQAAEPAVRQPSWHFSPAEDGFLSPLSSVDSRHQRSSSRGGSGNTSQHSQRPSRMSMPTTRSYDKQSGRPPSQRQLWCTSGASTLCHGRSIG